MRDQGSLLHITFTFLEMSDAKKEKKSKGNINAINTTIENKK